MAKKTVLTKNQKQILDLIKQEKYICQNFYLTGGTALAEYYLHHRLSEDLDFFSFEEFDPQEVFVFFKKIQKRVGIKKIDVQQSFNRHLFFLHLKDDVIKTEFTYFPFPRIKKGILEGGLEVDSLKDIAVNKIFTIYQKPRARDFIDLYFITKLKEWDLLDLMKNARNKFDWHIDLLQLGSQFLTAKTVKDYPKMIKKLDHKEWQNFFIKQAEKFKKEVLK